MKQKINLRLSLIALIAIVTTAIGITLVYYSIIQTRIYNDLKLNSRLLVETKVFQNTSYAGNDSDLLSGIIPEDLRITWIDRDGTVLFDNDRDIHDFANHLDRPEIQMAIRYGEGESRRRSETLHMNTLYYAQLLDNGTILRVSTQARTFFNVFMAAVPVIILIAACILIMCIIIGHFLTRFLMKPIEEMADNLDGVDQSSAYKELEPFANKIRSQHEDILSAVKSRQDFTANITHELKTPITAISGYAELIENGMVSQESQVHIASQIRHNADRLSNLVNDIIQLSELDHRELPRKFDLFDLYEVARESVNYLQESAQMKPVELILNGDYTTICAERSLIRELIDNLIQNAIRYNRENGKVWISVSKKNGHAILSIKDNGIGIPADQQNRVFERFYRVDKSRSRQTGGTGLGLAIVKHIADIHSAEILLISEVDLGTEIIIQF